MRLRHISRKKIKGELAPSGAIIHSWIGDELDVTEEDGAWLLTLRARSCNCGGHARSGGSGLPVYEVVE